MSNRKFLIIALLLTSFSAFASGGITRTSIIPPAKSYNGWFVGANALYFKPTVTNSKGLYGFDIKDDDDIDNNFISKKIEPDYHFGFNIFGGYYFNNMKNDVSLIYNYFSSKDSDSDEVSVYMFGIADLESTFLFKGSLYFNYNAIDLLFGQTIKMNDLFKVHLSGGVRYIQYYDKSKFVFDKIVGDIDYLKYYERIKYNGIGPRILLSGIYYLGRGFSLFGEIGSSILLGDIYQSELSIYAKEGEEESYLKNKEKPFCQNVPEVDVRIALNFAKMINHQANLSVEAGWQSMNYFNITLHPHVYGIASLIENKSTDFSLSGPYFGIKLSA